MNYKDLPLDQRMELASQYALLLVADNKPVWAIISIIKKDYALSEEQATQSVEAMRRDFKGEYNSTVRSNLFKTIGAAGVTLVAFFFYYFMGKGLGHATAFITFWAIMFGLGGVAALFVMGRIIWERFSKPTAQRPVITKTAQKLDNLDKFLQGMAAMSGMLLCFAAYDYFLNPLSVDVTKVVTVDNCIITEPVKYEHTSGKGRSYYYVLKLRGSDLDFRFFDRYYKYSEDASLVSRLQVGDTVSIQVLEEGFWRLRNQYGTGDVDIVNLGLNGHYLVDHAYRNARIRKDQKAFFHFLLVVFASTIPALFIKHRYNMKKQRRRTTR